MKRFKRTVAALLAMLMILTASPITSLADMVDKSGTARFADNTMMTYTYTAATDTLYVNCENLYLASYGQIPKVDFSFSHLVIGKDVKSIAYDDYPQLSKAYGGPFGSKYYYDFGFDISCEEGSVLESIGASSFVASTVTAADFTNATMLTTIDKFAFQYSAIESVKLPASITAINQQAFDNTCSMKEFIIDENVENLTTGWCCFQSSAIPEFNSPAGLVEIGEQAFMNCRKLEKITFLTRETEDGVIGLKTTGSKSFYNSGIKELVFPETAESLGGFYGMPKLEKVDFSNLKIKGLPSMKDNVSLRTVIFPKTEYTAPNFEGCTSLREVILGDNCTSYNSFVNCTSLRYVQLPNGITELKGFSGCTNLERVDFPDSITTIASNAFSGCRKLVITSLPETVTTINYGAFKNCESISLEMPINVKTVDSYAFYNSGITRAEFQRSLVTIGNYAFYNCQNLTDVILPASLRYDTAKTASNTIGQYTFYNCTSLEAITIPKSLTQINKYAFGNCTGLKSLTFEDNSKLTTIENSAFQGCSSLKEIKLPAKLKSLYVRAFKNCSSLESVNLDETALTSIADEAFSGCDFKEIALNNITAIGDQAFYNNKNLKKVELSENVVSAGAEAFYGCNVTALTINNPEFKDKYSNIYDNAQTISGYTNSSAYDYTKENNINFVSLGEYTPVEEPAEITCPSSGSYTYSNSDEETWYISDNNELVINISTNGESHSVDSYLYKDGEKYAIRDIVAQYGIDTIIIGEGFTEIYNNFLKNEKNVKNVQLPSTLKTINNYAFYNSGVTSITIPEGVTTIGDYAFYISDITSVTIPESVTKIGTYVFYGSCLEKLELPNSSLRLSSYAFGSCYRLKGVYIPENVSISQTAFHDSYGEMLDDFDLVVEIDSDAHEMCIDYNIRYRLNIDDDYISGYVEKPDFAKWIYYPESKELYYYANSFLILDYNGDGKPTYFYDNGTALTKNELDIDKLYVVDGAESLNQWLSNPLFADLNPKEIILPDTLKHIGEGTFAGLDQIKSITIPDSVTEIMAGAFDNSKSLEAIYLGEGVTAIENNLLKDNTSVRYIGLPSTLKTIGSGAFQGCTALDEIVIPSGVTSIGDNAFNKCLNVKTVTISGGSPYIGSGAFANLTFCDTVNIGSSYITYDNNAQSIFKNLGSSTTGVELNYTDDCTKADLAMFNDTAVVKINFGANVTDVINKQSLPRLKSFNVDEGNTTLISYENCVYKNTQNGLSLMLVPTALSEVVLKDDITEISDSAFYGCSVEHLTLPDSVNVIGNDAFKECRQLRKINLPSALERIQSGAFENCTKLKIVDLPSVKFIHENAFKGCTNLASILFPDTLQSIGANAFNSCTSLTCVVLPLNFKELCGGTFANCTSLENIYMLNTSFTANEFENSDNVKINTVAASDSYVKAREYKIQCVTYTNTGVFEEQCNMMENIFEGYLGFCSDEHGDIEYLTVYEPTCEQDGYIIGVCEYCSVILEEKHIEATGHSYEKTVAIAPTQTTNGVEKYTCTKCGESHTEYTSALDNTAGTQLCTVTGSVVIANDKNAQSGSTPLKSVNIKIGDEIVAVTDDEGNFSFSIESGVYELVLDYTYGFDRTVYIVANSESLDTGALPIVACDWNKDGKIDGDDLNLFRLIISSSVGDASYLDFADMNNDGTIDVKDLIYMNNVNGLDNSKFTYPSIVING